MLFYPPAVSDFDTAFIVRHVAGGYDVTLDERLREFFEADAVVTASSWVVLSGRLFEALREHVKDHARTEVVLARYSCNEFSKAIIMAGLTPIYVDLREDLTNDPEAIRVAIGRKTLAVLGINNVGVESDNAALKGVCDDAGVPYIEDATYTYLGRSDRDGRKFGTYGTFSILNFSEGKIIPCGGGGVVLNDPAYQSVADALRVRVDANPPLSAAKELVGLAVYRVGSTPPVFSGHFALKHRAGLDVKQMLSMEPTRAGEESFDLLRGESNEIGMLPERVHALREEPLRPLGIPRQLCGISVVNNIERIITERRHRSQEMYRHLERTPGLRLFPLPSRGVRVKLPFLFPEGPLREDKEVRLLGFGASKQYSAAYPMNGSPDFPHSNEFYDRLYTLPAHRYIHSALAKRVARAVRRVAQE